MLNKRNALCRLYYAYKCILKHTYAHIWKFKKFLFLKVKKKLIFETTLHLKYILLPKWRDTHGSSPRIGDFARQNCHATALSKYLSNWSFRNIFIFTLRDIQWGDYIIGTWILLMLGLAHCGHKLQQCFLKEPFCSI